MDIRRNFSTYLLLAAILTFASFSAGCGFIFFDGSSPQQVCSGGGETCVPQCETYCDRFLCWDECFQDCWYEEPVCVDIVSEDSSETEETTTTTTTTTTEEETTTTTTTTPVPTPTTPSNPSRCYNDHDCHGRESCVRGVCEQLNTTHRGTAGLCQVCENTNDCFEEGAKCIQINYDPVRRVGEKICGRLCEINSDCPPSFECVKTSDLSNSTAQCIPKVQSTDSGNVRTCNSTPQLQCVRARDCAAGQSCINNRCVTPNSCRDGRCSQNECRYSSDCDMGELCANARCAKSCRNSRDWPTWFLLQRL